MNEHEAACARLAADLAEAGVAPAQQLRVRTAYARALGRPSDVAWIAFYLGVHAALVSLERVAPAARGAFTRLLALIDDDLGAALIAPEQRERVRARLVEAA